MMNASPNGKALSEEVSAGGIVVRDASDGALYLVIKDSYRHWGFPKGHIEPGERPADAALREVGEETGLSGLSIVEPLGEIDWEFRFRGRWVHKVCHYFLMTTTDANAQPQRSEGITSCRWVPFSDAQQLLSYDDARALLQRAEETRQKSRGIVS